MPFRANSTPGGALPQSSPPLPVPVNTLAAPPSLSQEQIQHYLELKAVAAREGRPAPTLADVQVAMARRNAAAPALAPPRPVPGQGLNASHLTREQINSLPQIPPEMRVKIQAHLEDIKRSVDSGALSQDQADKQASRLQNLANTYVHTPVSPLRLWNADDFV